MTARPAGAERPPLTRLSTMSPWTAADIPDQSGRTVLVTGANSGLGLCSAEALAAKGAHVLLGCRDAAKGEAARSHVAAMATGRAPEVVALDLADLGSVRDAAQQVAGSVDRLDVLVNNAGVMGLPLHRTVDGFELQFATNHLGHFALTGLLLPVLSRTTAARVVTVSSNMHRVGRNDWSDPNWEHRRYLRWQAYGQSKLANLLFTRELARRAAAAGSSLVAVAAHPGHASTHLVPTSTEASRLGVVGRVVDAGNRLVAQSDSAGALPQLYAATMPDVFPGEYFGPDRFFQMRGHPTRVGSSAAARDDEAGRRLWELSEDLTGVTYAWAALV
jgi:NAD(P)-dependent dehydrogenase (short-subunit alcohol dehydrogenase family)